ncbi:NADPH oxidoreductase-like protein, putative [Medicago truncatula]|uniref:NADPH oxidoreductase-like protein, putative n=1 Tax=Medicago truncatula TaxID=3880 RepID=G7L661_MEDTR|nr:NADPH oxidoreductase-like protein, putative [Medicago truncatula]
MNHCLLIVEVCPPRFKSKSEYQAPTIILLDSFEKIVVHTCIVRAPLRIHVKPNHVPVKKICANVHVNDVSC